MNSRAVSMSLFMAGFAMFFVYSYVEGVKNDARRKFGTEVLVLKASKDINEQESITEGMITQDRIPKKFLEPAAIYIDPKNSDDPVEAEAAQKDADLKIRALFGAVAVVPIRKGEQMALNKVSEPGIRTGLAPQIAPGRRAVAVPVNEVTGVAKLVKPGDRVDVIAVIDTGAGKLNRVVKTVLQDVVVLAVGRNVTNNAARIIERDPMTGKERARSLSEDSSFASVTLEVEPSQAQVLALLISNGDNAINLSLRNNDDQEKQPPATVMMSDVLGVDRVRAPAQQVPAGGARP